MLTNAFHRTIINTEKRLKCMYTTDFVQVGSNIQKQLDMKGMTQQSLADSLNISKQVMNKIIKGSKAINVNELAKIAEILNISADELLMMPSDTATTERLNFMGSIQDETTLEQINLIRTAIDEINMLEELLNA